MHENARAPDLRNCIRRSIPEIYDAARFLDAAVSAHLYGRRDVARDLIRLSDNPAIRDWTESIWGKNSPYLNIKSRDARLPSLSNEQRERIRMPTSGEKLAVCQRDGFHCRFCGIPTISHQVRARIQAEYSDVLPWGRSNAAQHAAFQAMWAQYDHVLPYARGGDSELDNIVLTCAPCNFGRMDYTLEEVGLADPRLRGPVHDRWDGLKRFR